MREQLKNEKESTFIVAVSMKYMVVALEYIIKKERLTKK